MLRGSARLAKVGGVAERKHPLELAMFPAPPLLPPMKKHASALMAKKNGTWTKAANWPMRLGPAIRASRSVASKKAFDLVRDEGFDRRRMQA